MKILIALGLTFLVVAALRLGFDYRLPGLAIMALYLGSYVVLAWRLRRPARAADAAEPDPDYRDWPTSGPVGRFGQPALALLFTLTNLLSLFNPWQLVQVVRQLRGNARLQARERASRDDGRDYRCKVDYRLPFDGEWMLYNGGTTPKTSHSWDVLGQRYALDFVVADAAKRRHRGRGTRPEEYFCWARPILAAADGEVVAVRDGIGTAPLLGWGVCDFLARDFIGNHVLIRHAEGEYALYAHLVRGSIEVGVGDRVVAGRTIGRCGHSGHSSEPHLHFHLQDSADLYEGMSLPVRFVGIERNGAAVDAALLTAGDRVRMPASD